MAVTTATTRFWHPFADMGAVSERELVIERGEGVYVYDADGNRYLDGTASLWYANLGHSRREIADAVAAQLRTLPAYSTFGEFGNRPANELCERLAALAPMDDARVFLGSGGGDAIDTAAKIARRHWFLRRPAGAHAPDLPQPRLPRHARVRDQHRRDRGQHQQLGPAGAGRLGRPARLAGGARGRDPARRAGPRGRLLLRAGDRRRRRAAAGRRLHRGRRRPVRRARRPAGRRQRDLRLRPPRHVVRHRALGGRAAGPDHVRQGHHVRLPAARRRDRLRPGRGPVLRRAGRPDAAPRRHVRRPPDVLRRRARGARHLRAREHHPARA